MIYSIYIILLYKLWNVQIKFPETNWIEKRLLININQILSLFTNRIYNAIFYYHCLINFVVLHRLNYGWPIAPFSGERLVSLLTPLREPERHL